MFEKSPAQKTLLNEFQLAELLTMSVSWLRKDRIDKRLIPFFKIGGRVLYDADRVRAALILKYERGGVASKR